MHRSIHRNILAAALAATFALAGGSAVAATTTGNLPVSANVTPQCYVESVDPLVFSNVDTTTHGTDVDAQSGLSLTCTYMTHYNVAFGGGNNGNQASWASGTRAMIGGANGTTLLPYRLFRDVARANEIAIDGDLIATSFLGSGSPFTRTVYARVAAADFQSAPGQWHLSAGAYADTVVFTITF